MVDPFPCQRVGLARAFSTEPKVLLLDEPFAQIDALTLGVIQDELMRMWTVSRNTVFMVTHDVDGAIMLSDRIALMTSGPDARLAEVVKVSWPDLGGATRSSTIPSTCDCARTFSAF